MTCASYSTDASRYRSWLAPLPAPSCAGFGAGRGDGQTCSSSFKEAEAIAAADTILTVPNQLDVDDNADVIDGILTHAAPRARLAIGRPAISAIRPAQRRGLAPYRGSALSTARARIVTRQQIEDYQAVIQRAVIPARPRSQSGRCATRSPDRRRTEATGAIARGRSSILPGGLPDDLFAQVRAAPGRRPE